jgi:hypothetical protein
LRRWKRLTPPLFAKIAHTIMRKPVLITIALGVKVLIGAILLGCGNP